MHSRIHRKDRRNRATAAIRRTAVLAFSASLAFVVLGLPSSDHGQSGVVAQAFAAGENEGSAAVSVQKKNGFFSTESGADELAEPAIVGSGGSTAAPAAQPAPRQGSTTTHVIKEIAGVSEDTELSSEEELDAIRNGWGTWRTADGPESVIAQ